MKVFIAKTVAWLIAAIAALSSYGHQVALLRMADLDPIFGIPGEWVTPLTVDSLAIIALMIRMSDEVTDRTRKLAMIPLILAGSMAVAANVATANNVVQVIVGIWTVGSYIVAESFVGMMERKATKKSKEAEAPVKATASVGKRKASRPAISAKAKIIELAAATPRPSDAEIAAKVGTKPSWVKHVLKTATSD